MDEDDAGVDWSRRAIVVSVLQMLLDLSTVGR